MGGPGSPSKIKNIAALFEQKTWRDTLHKSHC
jgi:hypothetical protein